MTLYAEHLGLLLYIIGDAPNGRAYSTHYSCLQPSWGVILTQWWKSDKCQFFMQWFQG